MGDVWNVNCKTEMRSENGFKMGDIWKILMQTLIGLKADDQTKILSVSV